MLQVELKTFASDVLEDAMRLAQVKALNSFTFSDCANYLNYAWSDIYSRMAMIDDGYYGINVRLTSKLTKLPPFIKNSVQVYAAQAPIGYDREIFRSSGTADLMSGSTYRISGTDLWCPDAERRTVWLYYVPQCPQVFFTMYNRDPKIYDFPSVYKSDRGYKDEKLNDFYTYGEQNDTFNYKQLRGYSVHKYTNYAIKDNEWYTYNMETEQYTLLDPQPTGTFLNGTGKIIDGEYTRYAVSYFTDIQCTNSKPKNSWYTGEVQEGYCYPNYSNTERWYFYDRRLATYEDVTDFITAPYTNREDADQWYITYVTCDYPYIFVTYCNKITNEHISGFFTSNWEFTEYNPFSFTGRNSNVEYIQCKWNDKTGLGVLVRDYSDLGTPTVQEKSDGKFVELENVPVLKEMGWTPDTVMRYPIPEMYRYLVARLADKFSALNESSVMGVQVELNEARYAFEAFLDRDKSSWKRIENVNRPTIGDWL